MAWKHLEPDPRRRAMLMTSHVEGDAQRGSDIHSEQFPFKELRGTR